MEKTPKFPNTYVHSEGRTGTGQLIEFTCKPDDVEQAKDGLLLFRTIGIPSTRRVVTPHGTYGQYTRYDVFQHDYAGGGYPGRGGYIEILEVKDAPDNRHGIVVNEYNSQDGGRFTEFETVDQAKRAFKTHWDEADAVERFAKLPGFLRIVQCGELDPWFYAIGTQELVGDYAFPEHMQEDPVFKFGKKFVVKNERGIPVIKTCMGARIIEREDEAWFGNNRPRTYIQRVVYWDDGSSWDEINDQRNGTPRKIQEDELWVVEAMNQFQRLLAGDTTKFEIEFKHGGKFVGKLIEPSPRRHTIEGNYYARVTFKDGQIRAGSFDFKPTPEIPTVQEYLTSRLLRQGEILKMEIEINSSERGGKKWSGVFY